MYIKRKVKGRVEKIGVLVAEVVTMQDAFHTNAPIVKIGYSLCHKGLDVFDKKVGYELALERLNLPDTLAFPPSIIPDLKHFIECVSRWYKDKAVQTSYLVQPQ